MYFQKFPKTFYTLDNRSSVQVVTNFTLRVKLSDDLVNNFAVYDIYDIVDGDTPESLAFRFYGDTNLHWVILHANEILDPRFDWVLGVNDLYQFVLGKYDRVNGIHHYEDLEGNEVKPATIFVRVDSLNGFEIGSIVTSNSDTSLGYVSSIAGNVNEPELVIRVTKGGFAEGEQLVLNSNTSIKSNILSTSVSPNLVQITNLKYEEEQNELRRRIKIIKPQYIERIIKEFESKLSQVNG